MIALQVFAPNTPLHAVCLLACLAITAAFTFASLRSRKCCPHVTAVIRRIIVAGCLLSWLATTAYGFFPHKFAWDNALPLQFCNMANLLGALAVGRRQRWAEAMIYYWGLALCSWAFLTPTLIEGPALPEFWIFWGYHVFILISLAHVLFIDGFRPGWKDCIRSIALTAAYMAALAVVNTIADWNYGFLGTGKPGNTTPIDALGSYPLRLLWMALIGAAFFALLTLPWQWLRRKPKEESPS
ncbi:MAG: TIGR02206 family membrane protein [Verrucomicrobiales bacterium]|nr:TIGR02206 family membrane protein [Verrucomicrobiales bacterium]